MKRWISVFALICGTLILWAQLSMGKDNSAILNQNSRNTISLELEFTKKNASPLQRVVSFLKRGPNAYATGFMVGDRMVITAYHVVSGELDDLKKLTLGFGRTDKLEAKVYTNGCQAKVVKIDKEADLALLEVCSSPKQLEVPPFQFHIIRDEKVLLIARPQGDKVVSQGTFYGSYSWRGIEYWSLKIAARDGFSGSPIYNQQGEVVGVFSAYDWSRKLAIVSPATRAHKLIEEYKTTSRP